MSGFHPEPSPGLASNDHPDSAASASVLTKARRILNDVYWSPKRDVTGDDFEALDDALDVAVDLREAVRCFLSQRAAIAHAADLDAWTAAMAKTVAHMSDVLAAADAAVPS